MPTGKLNLRNFIYFTFSILFVSCGDLSSIDPYYQQQGCQESEFKISDGIYTISEARVIGDNCLDGVTVNDLNGRVISVKSLDSTHLLIDGNRRFSIGAVETQCGGGHGQVIGTPGGESSCAWTSNLSGIIVSHAPDLFSISIADIRYNPVGLCWNGLRQCAIHYIVTSRRVSP